MRTRRRKQAIAARVRWLTGYLAEDASVLDLGCGTGAYTKALVRHGYRVTGLDFSSAMLTRASQVVHSPRATFQQADSNAPLAFPAGAFDGVLSVLSFDHVRRRRDVP